MVADIVNFLIEGVAKLGEGLTYILPTSPFTLLENNLDPAILRTLNYFIPIKEIIDIASAWGIAVGSFYLYMLLLRWAKAIQ